MKDAHVSYNKATNLVKAKRTHMHATMACYTFSESSWHADTQSMSKWVTPLMAVMQFAKEHSTLSFNGSEGALWADVSPLLKYISGSGPLGEFL